MPVLRETRYDGRPRDHILTRHRPEQLQSFPHEPTFRVAGNKGVPEGGITDGRFVEHLASRSQFAELGVHIDQSRQGEDVGVETGPEEMGVEHRARQRRGEGSGGGEEEGEGVLVGRAAVEEHPGVEAEAWEGLG